jgi:hypothetical protein
MVCFGAVAGLLADGSNAPGSAFPDERAVQWLPARRTQNRAAGVEPVLPDHSGEGRSGFPPVFPNTTAPSP